MPTFAHAHTVPAGISNGPQQQHAQQVSVRGRGHARAPQQQQHAHKREVGSYVTAVLRNAFTPESSFSSLAPASAMSAMSAVKASSSCSSASSCSAAAPAVREKIQKRGR